MTEKEILERNKLIAEFMGGKTSDISNVVSGYQNIWLPKHGVCRWDTIDLGKGKILCYHKSWDWLMPVVEKIDGACFLGITWAHIKTNGTEIVVHDLRNNENTFECYPKINTQEATKLSVTYNAVVRYIEWYNQNK